MGNQPVARPLPMQTQNEHRQTFMPLVEFEPTIPAFERAKTVHAFDIAATVTGISINIIHLNLSNRQLLSYIKSLPSEI
jgi:hypothetical protein